MIRAHTFMTSTSYILFMIRAHTFMTSTSYILFMIRAHTFMTSTKNDHFVTPKPAPHLRNEQ